MSTVKDETLFAYSGRDKYGRKRKGTLFATSQSEANNKLSSLGIRTKRINKDLLQSITNRKSPSMRDKLFFTSQMATSLRAGIPVDTALRLTAENATNYKMRTAIREILEELEGGSTLTEAFEKQDHIFDRFYISLISVGESSGNLEYVMHRLAEAMDKLAALRRKIRKAMMYPAIVLLVGLSVVIFLLVFVIPQFEDMFASFGAELPLFTQIVLGISETIRKYFLPIVIAIIIIVWLIKWQLNRSESFRYKRDRLILSIPLIGKMVQQGLTARFGRTLGTLYESGTPMTESLEQTAQAMDNLVYQEIINDINDAVSQGERLGDAMRGTGGFDELTTSMVDIGEETGQLHVMLDRVSQTYEEQLDETTEALTTVIEPLLIVFLGIMVAIILIAIYLPIFSLGDAIA